MVGFMYLVKLLIALNRGFLLSVWWSQPKRPWPITSTNQKRFSAWFKMAASMRVSCQLKEIFRFLVLITVSFRTWSMTLCIFLLKLCIVLFSGLTYSYLSGINTFSLKGRMRIQGEFLLFQNIKWSLPYSLMIHLFCIFEWQSNSLLAIIRW